MPPCGHPLEKGLNSWLSSVWYFVVFVTFLCGVLGRVWYFIVSIPDFAFLLTFSQMTFREISRLNRTPPSTSTSVILYCIDGVKIYFVLSKPTFRLH